MRDKELTDQQKVQKLIDHIVAQDTRIAAQDTRIAALEADKKLADKKSEEESSAPYVRPQIDLLRHAAPVNARAIAVGNETLAGIREDARLPSLLLPRSMAAPSHTAPEPAAKRGSGWQEEQALRPPPGVALMDRMMDEEDRRDRADLLERSIARAKLAKDLPPVPKPAPETILEQMPVGGKK